MALNTATSSNNWGEFDGDLLNLVLSKLFGKDRLSFGLVCRRWNAVSKSTAPNNSPCLVYYHSRTRAWKFHQHNTLFSSSFPELEGAEVRCSKHGWLLMSRNDKEKDDTALFFFDPSNNHKVELPPLLGDLYTTLSFFHPPTSPKCVVVGIYTCMDTADTRGDVDVYALRQSDVWEIERYRIDHTGSLFYLSPGPPVLHGGMIYVMSVRGDVAILDIIRRRCVSAAHFNCLESDEDEEGPKELYLVKVKGEEEEDELFGVFVFGDEREVKVFRLSSSEMKWELMEEGIGDKVLYVSYTSCFGYKAPTKEMENTICFPMFRGDVPVFYSLSDAKYRPIDGEYSEGNAHGLRSLEFATWVLPTPAWEVDTNFVC